MLDVYLTERNRNSVYGVRKVYGVGKDGTAYIVGKVSKLSKEDMSRLDFNDVGLMFETTVFLPSWGLFSHQQYFSTPKNLRRGLFLNNNFFSIDEIGRIDDVPPIPQPVDAACVLKEKFPEENLKGDFVDRFDEILKNVSYEKANHYSEIGRHVSEPNLFVDVIDEDLNAHFLVQTPIHKKENLLITEKPFLSYEISPSSYEILVKPEKVELQISGGSRFYIFDQEESSLIGNHLPPMEVVINAELENLQRRISQYEVSN